jgi:ATP-dependent DNA helicase RecG
LHITFTAAILNNPIEYIHGISTLRGDMLRKELQIFTFNDLLNYFPLRHVDKTKVDKIGDLNSSTEYTQVSGTITDIEILGEKRSKRLVAYLKDDTGEIELVWFQGINWIQKTLHVGHQYLVFGKLSFFINKPQIAHPEIETLTTGTYLFIYRKIKSKRFKRQGNQQIHICPFAINYRKRFA